MSEPEWRAFVTHGTRTAALATTRSDGRPHVAPVWFVLDDETPPFAFVLIEGTTTISADLDEMLGWATRIGGRYMGTDRAEAFGRRNAVEGELLIRLTPERVVARRNIADE